MNSTENLTLGLNIWARLKPNTFLWHNKCLSKGTSCQDASLGQQPSTNQHEWEGPGYRMQRNQGKDPDGYVDLSLNNLTYTKPRDFQV